jgi:hypothetical protein
MSTHGLLLLQAPTRVMYFASFPFVTKGRLTIISRQCVRAYEGGGGGARRSVLVKGTMPQARRSRVRYPLRLIFFLSIYLIRPAALGPGVCSATNRNEYQKQKNNVSGE